MRFYICNSIHCILYRGFSPYSNFITANFITAIFQKIPQICLMRIFGYFISLVRFFGLIWLMRIFSRTKSRIRQKPSVLDFSNLIFWKSSTYRSTGMSKILNNSLKKPVKSLVMQLWKYFFLIVPRLHDWLQGMPLAG